VLFINSRLVECGALKRACEAVYGAILPKAEKPFMFMSLDLPPATVDVNVHPTKREVHFLHQDDVVEAIQSAVGLYSCESSLPIA
jgi:DNA mismatch repair protein MLH1